MEMDDGIDFRNKNFKQIEFIIRWINLFLCYNNMAYLA